MIDFIRRHTRFVVTTAIGSVVLLLGLVLLPTPMPLGWLLVPAGLIILAREIPAARRLLDWIKTRTGLFGKAIAKAEHKAIEWVNERFSKGEDDAESETQTEPRQRSTDDTPNAA